MASNNILKYFIFLTLMISFANATTSTIFSNNIQPNGRKINVTKQPPVLYMSFHGGEIMNKTITVFYIWYGNFSNSSVNIMRNYTKSLNASTWWNINRSYGMTNITFGASIFVPVSSKSLSSSDLRSIVEKSIEKNLVPLSPQYIYVILTDPTIQVYNIVPGKFEFCVDVCGWHGPMIYNSQTIKYVFTGSPKRCPGGCSQLKLDNSDSPNKNAEVDGMINVVSHELAETSSDPNVDAWYDSKRDENADKCAWNFGKIYKGTTYNPNGIWNENFGDRKYLIQMNWGIKPTQKCYQ